MVIAAFLGLICLWLFGLCFLGCAFYGLRTLIVGHSSGKVKSFVRSNRVRGAVFLERKEAIEEGGIMLVGGLFLAAPPLLLALQATPEIWSLFWER